MPNTILGPFIGLGEREARIWLRGISGETYRVRVSRSGGSVLAEGDMTASGSADTAMLHVELHPSTAYTAEVSGPGLDVPVTLAFRSLPAAGVAAPLRLGFLSCHQPFHDYAGKKRTLHGMRLANRLSEMAGSPAAPELLILCGDQVYADAQEDALLAATTDDQRRALYRQVYDTYWSLPEWQRLLQAYPSISIWDDHEILDGWGSRGFEAKHAAVRDAAGWAYDAFQGARNPDPMVPGGRFYGLLAGRVAIVVPDLRTFRSIKAKTLLGPDQLGRIRNWLADRRGAYDTVVVVTSVPVVHLKGAIANLLHSDLWGPLKKLIPALAEKEDDLADQWTDKAWREDARAFLDLMFEVGSQGHDVLFVGGDVHVGGMAVARSQDHPACPRIYQATSSPISNQPEALQKALPHLQAGFSLVGPYSGRLLDVIPERNAGIIQVRPGQTPRLVVQHLVDREPELRELVIAS
ncbi:MAG: alkaline phosphatase D family protein [bacterium]